MPACYNMMRLEDIMLSEARLSQENNSTFLRNLKITLIETEIECWLPEAAGRGNGELFSGYSFRISWDEKVPEICYRVKGGELYT